MANEIRISGSVNCINGSFRLAIAPPALQITQTTARGGNPGVVNVGTSEEVIAFGDIVALGYCFIRNLSATRCITFGPESSGAMVAAIKLKPGEWCILRLVPGTTYRAKADTSACDVLIQVLDD